MGYGSDSASQDGKDEGSFNFSIAIPNLFNFCGFSDSFNSKDVTFRLI